jgi:hypothetical protein
MMSVPIHVTAGNHAGPKSQRGLERYLTPACAVEALVTAEALPQKCWEPCGGDDENIAIVLRSHGKTVLATDLGRDGIDFRDRREAPPGTRVIVANPPFSLAADFVRHGLTLVPKVVILERIQWLEADARADLFDGGKLVRVHIFRNRVPRMHLEGWDGKRASPAMMLAWFIFDRAHDGSRPELKWIRCEVPR